MSGDLEPDDVAAFLSDLVSELVSTHALAICAHMACLIRYDMLDSMLAFALMTM